MSYDAGRYRLKVVGADLGEAENGTPHVELYIEITAAFDELGQLCPCAPGTRTVYLSLTDATLGTFSEPGWVAQTLTDLGFDWSFGRFDERRAYHALVGKERNGQCAHEDYQGKTREKWGIYRDSRSPLKPASSDTVKGLNSKFGPLMKQFAKNQVATTSVKPSPVKPSPVKPTSSPAQNALPAPTRPLQATPSSDADYTPPDDPNISGSEIPF